MRNDFAGNKNLINSPTVSTWNLKKKYDDYDKKEEDCLLSWKKSTCVGLACNIWILFSTQADSIRLIS